MSTQVKVSTLPECDICLNAVVKQHVPAYADAKLNVGSWANVCRKHFETYGCSLGTGQGQQFVVGTEQSQDERIKENLKGVDFNNISLEEFEDMFEDRDPFEFM